MIYWDNAATTWPKPRSIVAAVGQAFRYYGANPGRAGHKMAMDTAEQVYGCREELADYFGLSDPTGVIFTQNCTASLNMVIAGLLAGGGRAVVSDLEHNAVMRPLAAVSPEKGCYDVAEWSPNPAQTVENFRRAIRPDTRLLICTHASNVFGVTFPIRELGALAREHGLWFCVDAAQSAGTLPLHMEQDGIDFLCVAPHKGLYAPTGTGVLLCRDGRAIPPLIRGGTGSQSLLLTQPEELPDRLESGTPNVPGICGIRAGLAFVRGQGRERIYHHEIALLQQVYERLAGHNGIRLYTPFPVVGHCAPVLAVGVEGIPSETVAKGLDEFGVSVRAGLHCAPCAHRRFGTQDVGTVRLAPSVFSTREEAEKISKLFLQIAKKIVALGRIYAIICIKVGVWYLFYLHLL